jgi:acid phosphatase
MSLLVTLAFKRSSFRNVIVGATAASVSTVCDASRKVGSATATGTATPINDDSSTATSPKIYRTLQVQIVHRHGDRTPITPLIDEAFWAGTLIPEATLARISSNTHLIQDENANKHTAAGRGPFGKLTELGLLQLVKLGNKLREDLVTDQQDHVIVDENTGDRYFPHVFHPERPLHPSNIRVMSTDFSRTIQSVQGLLVGLFPDGTDESIAIDVLHTTSWMIPDPQPRRSRDQEQLEYQLSAKLNDREKEMLPFAIKVTKALGHMLASDAHEFSFGVSQENAGKDSIEVEPLAWNQLAEITKCLAVRNRLPPGITEADQEAISQHAAWRWFMNMRDPRLSFMAMNPFTSKQVEYMVRHETEPALTIWSAHDSSLIGLLCAYRLEQPSVWPEYGSYLMLELLEVSDAATAKDDSSRSAKEYVVRFSLNGQVLRSEWGGVVRETIPLDLLEENIRMT